MTKTELVKAKMIEALKAHDKETKESLSMLLQALQKAAKEKREELTETEENVVILKEIKQAQETIESCPVERTDIMGFMLTRINLYEQFAPKQITKEAIREIVNEVIIELGIDNPTKKDKGKIMKNLMLKVKGQADGKDINAVVDSILK